MQRFFRIFSIYLEDSLTYRSLAFVWFLFSLIIAINMLIFWNAALPGGKAVEGLSFSSVSSYYLLSMVLANFLLCHPEESVASEDIYQGGLVRFLLQPFPYLLVKFLQEIPWRLMTGTFAVIAVVFIAVLQPGIEVIHSPIEIVLFLLLCVIAFFLSFFMKLCIGYAAFWLTTIKGIVELFDITLLVFSGAMVPISFFNSSMQRIFMVLPFAFTIYVPTVALQGKLAISEMLQYAGIGSVWLILFITLSFVMWKKGVKKFTGVGQ
jgi:ABC-2 type transport system permease protein